LAIYSCPSDSTAIKHIDISFIDKNYRENKLKAGKIFASFLPLITGFMVG
jgi:hypothetical protein